MEEPGEDFLILERSEFRYTRFTAFCGATSIMNIARGMFRLWIVVSVAWVLLLAGIMRPDQAARTYWNLKHVSANLESEASENGAGETEAVPDSAPNQPPWVIPEGRPGWWLPEGFTIRPSPEELVKRRNRSLSTIRNFLGSAVLLPLILLLGGVVLGWVSKGFRRK